MRTVRTMRTILILTALLAVAASASAQGRGRGGGPVQVMTLTTTGWTDGGAMPEKYGQVGHEVSPPLTWSNPPDTAKSFVLIVHDIDTPNSNGTDDTVQWLVWNIPGVPLIGGRDTVLSH